MAKKKVTSVNQMMWQPSLFRCTAFFKQADVLHSNTWWKDIFGTEAESQNRNQRSLEYLDESTFSDYKISLSVNPARMDLRMSVPTEFNNQLQFITLGSFQDNHNIFNEVIAKWLRLPNLPAISRFAYGLILLKPVQRLDQGYEFLQPLLHEVNLDIGNSSDFLYQINRPKDSETGIPNLRINRLSKWAVLRVNAALMSSSTPVVVEVPDSFAAHLELDINTTKESVDTLPSDKLSKVYSELVDFAIDIAQNGDKA